MSICWYVHKMDYNDCEFESASDKSVCVLLILQPYLLFIVFFKLFLWLEEDRSPALISIEDLRSSSNAFELELPSSPFANLKKVKAEEEVT